jgi:protein O-GlcNAc transferase
LAAGPADHFALAMRHAAVGDLDTAATHFRHVLRLDPRHAPSHNNLGTIYRTLGRLEPAEASYRRAIKAEPRYALAHLNLGAVLLARGEAKRAASALQQGLALDPGNADGQYNLALAQTALAAPEAAEASYRRALACDLHHIGALNNLAALRRAAGDPAEAEALYRRLLSEAPSDADAHSNLAGLLLERGDVAAAEPHLAVALAQARAHVPALMAAASAAQAQRDLAGAAALLRRAVAASPDHAGALHQLGRVTAELGDLPAAIAAYEAALARQPDMAAAFSGLVSLRRTVCDWREFASDRRRLGAAVAAGAEGIAPANLLFQTDDPRDLLIAARRRSRAIAHGIVPLPPLPAPPRDRIRLGYLSGDFREHAVAFLTAGIFERHDRTRFTVTGYSYGPDDAGPTRRRLERGFDRLVEIGPLPHRAAAERIRADGIDILIDMMGHTSLARPQIPAHRPAPVQVGFLGYPATMGAPFIDYVIADRHVAPVADQPFFDERIVQLPDTYYPTDYGQPPSATPSRADCGLPEDGFVFCCFNQAHKIAPELFAVWMRLLAAVPGSVLWLFRANATAEANLRREAAAAGIASSRLVFAPLVPPTDHLARLRLADLFLDTLPYNAHTTATDALSVGLPVLTCAGATFPGRVAKSLLLAIGLPELVTANLGEYEGLALRLARDAERLAALRARLAANRRAAPLFDTARYTKHLEVAFTLMHERRLAGEPAVGFAVPRLNKDS